MRATFIASEVGTGLRRNLTMTIAVVIITAISLFFFGAGLLLRAQVEQLKTYWYDRVEVSVFLCGAESDPSTCPNGEVTPEQRADIEIGDPGMTRVTLGGVQSAAALTEAVLLLDEVKAAVEKAGMSNATRATRSAIRAISVRAFMAGLSGGKRC